MNLTRVIMASFASEMEKTSAPITQFGALMHTAPARAVGMGMKRLFGGPGASVHGYGGSTRPVRIPILKAGRVPDVQPRRPVGFLST